MARNGQFFLARISKAGRLTDRMIGDALAQPAAVTAYKYAWTITDFKKKRVGRIPYYYGKLAKYEPDALVDIVDARTKQVLSRPEPNLAVATSPFVIVPSESVVSYLHVWNHIERHVFRQRLAEVIEASYQRFFVECSIDPIVDLRPFIERLSNLRKVTRIKATVHPPNPLFGPLWDSLKRYLDRRSAKTLTLNESSPESLKTDLMSHVNRIEAEEGGQLAEAEPADVTDAAVLLAADGYGHATVIGQDGSAIVQVRTKDSVVSFKLPRDAPPSVLVKKTLSVVNELNKQRRLQHGKRE